jgi:hypothetical protein
LIGEAFYRRRNRLIHFPYRSPGMVMAATSAMTRSNPSARLDGTLSPTQNDEQEKRSD